MDRRKALKLSSIIAGITTLPLTVGMIQSCQPTGTIDWVPSYFTRKEAKGIENLAESILPSTSESPGASEVHVAEFIDRIVKDCMRTADQQQFKKGMGALDEDCLKKTGAALDQKITDKMISYVQQLDKAAFSGNEDLVHSTYRELKQLVLLGFFTSEKVMTTALNYKPIPGKYVGCVPLADDPKVYIGNNVAG